MALEARQILLPCLINSQRVKGYLSPQIYEQINLKSYNYGNSKNNYRWHIYERLGPLPPVWPSHWAWAGADRRCPS